MATGSVNLTTDWQLITSEGFIGQKGFGAKVELTNSVGAPSGATPKHSMTEMIPLYYAKPIDGEWYGKILNNSSSSGSYPFTFTEV